MWTCRAETEPEPGRTAGRGRPSSPRSSSRSLTRGDGVVGIVVLFLLFVPIEKLFALRPQRVFRAASGPISPICWRTTSSSPGRRSCSSRSARSRSSGSAVRSPGGCSPARSRSRSAVAIVFVGAYWGHRLSHTVPFLWRFHAVHHSIEQMDWLAAGRLHPLDRRSPRPARSSRSSCSATPAVSSRGSRSCSRSSPCSSTPTCGCGSPGCGG